MAFSEEQVTRHPSFGVLKISRVTFASFGGLSESERTLFGSSIRHHEAIKLSIERAKLIRNLNQDTIMFDHDEPLVEVMMSSTQFADAITSFNEGDGTPCTITYFGGKSIASPPFISKRMQFDAEFEQKMKEVASELNDQYKVINSILSKPNIGKKDREEIQSQLRLIQQEIRSNIPFVKEQFTEQMDKIVLEAKNEFDAFMDSKIRTLGLEGFKTELKQLAQRGTMAALEEKTE